MNIKRFLQPTLILLTTLLIAVTFLLTFTMSDYYIFNRMVEFGVVFPISQWGKKACFLLILLAVFYKRKGCAHAACWLLPLCVVLSVIFTGNFFDIQKVASTPADEVYLAINNLIPRTLNIVLFYIQNALYLLIVLLLFVRDGVKGKAHSLIYLPLAFVACVPLNIFENFFDINTIPLTSPLRFYSLTIWHLVAIIVLIGLTVGAYFFLKHQSEERRRLWLNALAIVLLIQYHSKDSMILGDGYNVYHTVLSCVPLFICNIGVYVAAISVLSRKRILYAFSFYIHAAGALTVFVYFGKNEMSNYGIFCSYSILYFCLTHSLLFILSIMPTIFGMYRFRFKDMIPSLIYYFVVIVLAAVASALVTSWSETLQSTNGSFPLEDNPLMPNYAFTQINPLPFEVPAVLTLTIWKYPINVLYILGLYIVYVALFEIFNGCYFLSLKVQNVIHTHAQQRYISRAKAFLNGLTNHKHAENSADKSANPADKSAEMPFNSTDNSVINPLNSTTGTATQATSAKASEAVSEAAATRSQTSNTTPNN
jgi:hypothetical protein